MWCVFVGLRVCWSVWVFLVCVGVCVCLLVCGRRWVGVYGVCKCVECLSVCVIWSCWCVVRVCACVAWVCVLCMCVVFVLKMIILRNV